MVEHDATIGHHCHISTGTYINGGCTVHDNSFIGSSSVLVQGITIATNNIIAAGAVVTHSTQPDGAYAGSSGPTEKTTTLMSHVIIIAEVGADQHGLIENALRLIELAAEAGVDYIKFQTFKASNLVSNKAEKAGYQKQNMKHDSDNTQSGMLQKLELSHADHLVLMEHCKKNHIKFFSTAFDMDSIDLLNSFSSELWKIPSGEITNLPYLEKIGSFNKQVILSTGMCTMQEIKASH